MIARNKDIELRKAVEKIEAKFRAAGKRVVVVDITDWIGAKAMSYDLETINQAWYIACEECMEYVPDEMTNEAMLTYVADYCRMHSSELIKQAVIELIMRKSNAQGKK